MFTILAALSSALSVDSARRFLLVSFIYDGVDGKCRRYRLDAVTQLRKVG